VDAVAAAAQQAGKQAALGDVLEGPAVSAMVVQSAQAGVPAAHAAAADEQDADMHDAVAVVATTAPAPVAASAEGGVSVASAVGKEAAHAAAIEPVKVEPGLQYAAVTQQQQQQLAALIAAEAEQPHALVDEQQQDQDQEQAEVSTLNSQAAGNGAASLCRFHVGQAVLRCLEVLTGCMCNLLLWM
jgi:hypothetical protein